MADVITPATHQTRTGRPTPTASGPAPRRVPPTGIPVMPLWEGLARLFTPSDPAHP